MDSSVTECPSLCIGRGVRFERDARHRARYTGMVFLFGKCYESCDEA